MIFTSKTGELQLQLQLQLQFTVTVVTVTALQLKDFKNASSVIYTMHDTYSNDIIPMNRKLNLWGAGCRVQGAVSLPLSQSNV